MDGDADRLYSEIENEVNESFWEDWENHEKAIYNR